MSHKMREHDGDYTQDDNTKGGGWEDGGSVQRDCINLKHCAANPHDYALYTKIPYFDDKDAEDYTMRKRR